MEKLNQILKICRQIDDSEIDTEGYKIKRQARYELIRELIDAEVI